MSGEDLRNLAQQGDLEIAPLLKAGANPCSQDEFGLNPLMFAVWNGHVECVKYLVSNTHGVNGQGLRMSALDQVSCKGYSALHLAALDCPPWVATEITLLLLVMGVDPMKPDKDGRLAIELAQENPNQESLLAFEEVEKALAQPGLQAKHGRLKSHLMKKYHFERQPKREVTTDWVEGFPVPDILLASQGRMPSLPVGMKLHERMLKPLIEEGDAMEGITAYKCLRFATEEATANQDRRESLIKASDPDWVPVPNSVLNQEIEAKKKGRWK